MSKIKLMLGDCLDSLKSLPENSVDSLVTDPPYGISFMGKKWDYEIPSVEIWREAMRVLKPGGHALIACGTRTQHRMVCNIEDAGFEIRDVVTWMYGSGFPKSLNIGKAIDKSDSGIAQKKRQYKFTEWVRSTGLTSKIINDVTNTKMGSRYTTHPSQPAIMNIQHLNAVRHLISDVPEWVEEMVKIRSVESENFKSREVVGTQEMRDTSEVRIAVTSSADTYDEKATRQVNITTPATDEAKEWDGWGTALKPACEFFTLCRKPLSEKTIAANVLKWGTGGINIDACRVGTSKEGRFPANLIHDGSQMVMDLFPETKPKESAARFFYCPKASKSDREEGNTHPTVKPTDLMAYLVRLITPKGGTVVDNFMGSGSTGKAAIREGFDFIGMELTPEYFEIAKARIK